MRKCCIIGGSNGLGLAIAKTIEDNFDEVYILDITTPAINIKNSTHLFFDLFKDDVLAIENLLLSVDCLIITAGIGRVSKFENLNHLEIEKTININFLNTVKILNIFYQKLLSTDDAYCMVVGSFAGELSSPLFSVYGACKAGINKLCESLNIELEMSNSKNRITNVMPLSFTGSSFNGGKTDVSMLNEIAKDSIEYMYQRRDAYIPQDELCSDILGKYRNDKYAFGISSYKYKIDNNRLSNRKMFTIGYMSGTFDLFHIGHLNMIRLAKKHCDYLVVGVHKDASHKGKETFISFEERKEIVKNIRFVDEVIDSLPEDSDVWKNIKYDFLFVGSDYKGTERFNKYEKYFEDKNVEIIYFPYTQTTSSSELRKLISLKIKELKND